MSEEYERETRSLLTTHIEVTQLKLNNIKDVAQSNHNDLSKDVKRLEASLKWAGGIVISLMLSFMGWALLQQFNANDAQKRDMQQQIELLKQQQQLRLEASSAPQPADAAGRLAEH